MSPFSAPTFTPALSPPQAQTGTAYWFLFQGDRLIVQASDESAVADPVPAAASVPLLSVPAAAGLVPTRTQYLGYLTIAEQSLIDCYSGEIPADATLPVGFDARGLRELFGALDSTALALAGRAVQIVNWDRTHQYCGRCGAPMDSLPTERAKKCPTCGLTNYPRLSPAIIIAVTRETEEGRRILLARNHRFPPGRFSVIAGFVEPGETLEECCRREVCEEVGIDITNIRYVSSQPWPFPNSLMLGFTADYAGGDFQLEASEIAEAGWFGPDNLPKLPPKVSIARQLIDQFLVDNGVDLKTATDW